MTTSKDQSSLKFWDRVAERYAARPVSDQETYEKKLEITRGYLRPDMHVLEIGCGTGTTALVHAPHVDEILATDISENMIEIARSKARAQDITNVWFKAIAIGDLEFPTASFDMVIAHNILHLVPDRAEVIARIFGWLRPGGLMVSSTACLNDGLAWLRLILPPLRWLGRVPYVEFFSARQLEKEFRQAGFEVEHNWLPKPRAAVFMVLRKEERRDA